MRIVTAAQIADVLNFPDLVEALERAFQSGIVTPRRHHHVIAQPDQSDATLLLMPAWTDFADQGHSDSGYIGIKILSLYPDNPSRGHESILGNYLLLSGKTGAPLAIIDGPALTLWRTAAASALAARYLADENANRLVMVGAGALAGYLIKAHASVRPIDHVSIWNRTAEKAEKLADDLAGPDWTVGSTNDLESAVQDADIISCATMSDQPLIKGEWLKPGAHLDLVGAYNPNLRESDDACVRRARIYVDTRDGALAEAGDIVQPLAAGIITEADIVADLFELCREGLQGRRSVDEITLFKSVGTAIEDLAAAELVYSRLQLDA